MGKRTRSVIAVAAVAVAVAVVMLITVGPWGRHLERPGKPPLGYLREPLGGRHYRVTAWTLGDTAAFNTATAAQAVDEIDFDWYHSHRNGSVTADHENLNLVAAARAKNLNIFATVTNSEHAGGAFDHNVAAAIMATQITRRHFITNLVNLVEKKGFDGIDLDWENLKADDRGRYSALVTELAKALHAEGRFLSVAVFPKTTAEGSWGDQVAVDYKRIGAACDEFKIMLYSFSGPWGEPGPQAPTAWADKVLNLAQQLVPAGKISMGVPFYGYDWHAGSVTPVTADDVMAAAKRANAGITRDPASNEAIVRYQDENGVDHVVYFQDQQALVAKIDLLRHLHPGLNGISIWEMGQQGAGFWDVIKSELK